MVLWYGALIWCPDKAWCPDKQDVPMFDAVGSEQAERGLGVSFDAELL